MPYEGHNLGNSNGQKIFDEMSVEGDFLLYYDFDDCDTAQGKDAPRGNFLMLYAEYLGRYNKI